MKTNECISFFEILSFRDKILMITHLDKVDIEDAILTFASFLSQHLLWIITIWLLSVHQSLRLNYVNLTIERQWHSHGVVWWLTWSLRFSPFFSMPCLKWRNWQSQKSSFYWNRLTVSGMEMDLRWMRAQLSIVLFADSTPSLVLLLFV